MPDVNASWSPALEAEASSGLPRPLEVAVLLPGAIWTALESTWLKTVTVWTVGMAARRCGGKMTPAAWEKLAPKEQEAPRRSAWHVAGMGRAWAAVPLTLTAPKPTGGTKGELAGVVGTATAVALTRLWRRGVGAGVAGAEVCSDEKGATLGAVLRGPRLPKTGWKVGVGRPGGDGAETVADVPGWKESPVAPVAGSPEAGLGAGSTEAAAGGAGAGRRGAELRVPKDVHRPVSDAGATAGGSRGVVVPPGRAAEGGLGAAVAGGRGGTVAVDLESEEVPGRGSGCEPPREGPGLGSSWAARAAGAAGGSGASAELPICGSVS